MSIQLIKKTDADPETEHYEKNLRKHHLKNMGLIVGALVLVLGCLYGFKVHRENRNYESYEVTRSFERQDTVNTKYAEFLKYVLKYGQDGISCVDHNNNLVWSQTYNMQHPIIHVCGSSAALAEENGTEAMIFDETGLQGTIETRLPIRQIAVSSQGVLAALLEDGDVMRLSFYNKKGEELVNSKFELQETGYPLQMSLSSDATKLAVVFLQVENSSVNGCLAFYNFDSVGENYEDHLVASKVVQGMVIPSVHYIDKTHCFAVGSGQLLLYEGEQIPELKEEIPIDREIYSVFSSEKGIGLVLEGTEEEYALQFYNVQGKLEFETEFDMDYQTLKFSGNNILIYNEFECMILNSAGKIFFTGEFEDSISNLYTLSGHNRYIVMHASRTDQIRLK